jgi:hypothetical protein
MVAMLILVPTAMAQEMTVMQEETMMMETTQPLPKSGGPAIGSTSVLLPAAALLWARAFWRSPSCGAGSI